MQTMVGPRLALMMFLQFFVWGVWWVPLSIYMGTERIAMGHLIFWAYLSAPIAAIISPFFLGLVADRFFASERVLGLLHLLGGLALCVAPTYAEQGEAGRTAFLVFVLLHMLCYMPTIGLTNTVAFASMTNPERQFPLVRVFGTIGWIVAGVLVGIGLNLFMVRSAETTTIPFYLGAGAAFLLGLYSFTLPHTPPPLKGQRPTLGEITGVSAVAQLSSQSFWTFLISSVLLCIPLAAYYAYTALFAQEAAMEQVVSLVGFEMRLGVAAWMSTGQMMEVLFMLLMPLAFLRLGVKWMLIAGMAAWVVRYALFSVGAPDQVFWMLWLGILLHGICYDFFFVTGMVYVERKAPPAIRAQAQGFLVQMTLGVGMFIGTLITGWLFNWLVEPFSVETQFAERMAAYQTFWAIPAIFAAAVMVFFALLFRDQVQPTGIDEADVADAAGKEKQP